MTWTSGVGRACGVLLDAIVRLLALSRINPNVLTLMGLVVNTYAAFLFGYANGDNQRRMFFYAGLVIIGSGFFDLVDGRVARASNKVTRFGGFFDSIVDRYSDASLFLGLLVFYGRGNRFFYVVLAALAMISAIMVSYARARAESLIGTCRVGFMERPERLVLLIIGALFNVMAPVLWVIAVLSTITVIHRIIYTWQRTTEMDAPARGRLTAAGSGARTMERRASPPIPPRTIFPNRSRIDVHFFACPQAAGKRIMQLKFPSSLQHSFSLPVSSAQLHSSTCIRHRR